MDELCEIEGDFLKRDDEILNILIAIYKKYVNSNRKINNESQLCCIWPIDDPPDVLEATDQLNDIEDAFNININEDDALILYDMNLIEASQYIKQLLLYKKNTFK